MNKRLHIYYSGSVQGVGFRYTARDVAFKMHLTGWVRNLRDGRVEVLAEGEKEALKSFISQMRASIGSCIRDEDIYWLEATEEFEGFEIRFL